MLLRSGLPGGYRIMPARHAANPLGTVPADSRFGSRGGYAVLYASPDFATAFIETVVRDRFTHRRERRVALKEVTDRAWARISTRPEAELMLLDLRGDGCTRIGAPTDTVPRQESCSGACFCERDPCGAPRYRRLGLFVPPDGREDLCRLRSRQAQARIHRNGLTEGPSGPAGRSEAAPNRARSVASGSVGACAHAPPTCPVSVSGMEPETPDPPANDGRGRPASRAQHEVPAHTDPRRTDPPRQ